MPDAAKADLRKTAHQIRAAIAPADHTAWSEACCRKLAAWLGILFQGSYTVALYHPIKTELDISRLWEFLPETCVVALPAIHSSTLTFHALAQHDPLHKGEYDIHIPVTPNPVTPDIIITPLLAFDRSGNRLGYGGGFYDRTIQQLRIQSPALHVIGAAFACQQQSTLPFGPHDERMDAIVTQKEILTIPRENC